MTPDEHARRYQLWHRHIMQGEDREAVIADLTAEFDVDAETLQDDVATINQWLPRLDPLRNVGGVSLLAEVRANRQQLHQLATEARDADDRTEERKVREEINRSLNLERRIREGKITEEKSDKALETEEMLDNFMETRFEPLPSKGTIGMAVGRPGVRLVGESGGSAAMHRARSIPLV